MEGSNGEVDLISELPEPILQLIMSFLPFEEAVQTSILSKIWNQAWDTYPTLEFTDVCYNINRKKDTLKYMEHTLLKRLSEKISMKKLSFRMELSNYPESAPIIDQSLYYAIGCNVRELKLEIVYWGSVWWYNLPQSVLCAKSIAVLDLEGCKLKVDGSVRLPSLRKLLLKHVKAENGVIDDLVARCPRIEYLTIDQCEGFNRLELFSDSRVDQIKVRGNYELEWMNINIVNVNSAAIYGPTMCEINIAPCKSLKCLKLDMVSMPGERLSNQISELPLLEYLSVTDCRRLKIIKVSNPCLQKLLIFRCADLGEVRIETPNLSTFKYVGNIISVSANALNLSETDLYVYEENMNIDSDWLIAYNKLLATLHSFSKVLNLQSYTGENAIVPTEARSILRPPLCGKKHLKFTIDEEEADFSIGELVDGLLWNSSHLETLSLEFRNRYCDNFFFQFSYKNEITYEGGYPRCCQALPVLCWKDCIKKVEIEHIITKKRGNKVRRYSFEDEESWEKIKNLRRYKS